MPAISTAVKALVSRQTAATARYDWILAITFIAYIFSAASNGANDVANSYATSVYGKPCMRFSNTQLTFSQRRAYLDYEASRSIGFCY